MGQRCHKHNIDKQVKESQVPSSPQRIKEENDAAIGVWMILRKEPYMKKQGGKVP